VNRNWYRALCVFEAVAIVVVIFALTIPIQDYALREYKEWQSRPSSETLRAFREKHDEEFQLRLIVATPFALAALLLAIPLFRFRPKSGKSNQPSTDK
jgi:hypothetical protein